jgi:predicted ATP-binding protein involved in virulence
MSLENIIILVASLISSISVILKAVDKILDKKMNGLYDNLRLQYRYEICSFSGDLRNGITKTREEFQAIFEMYDRYEQIVKDLNLRNHFIDNEMAYVTEQYKKLEEGRE